MVTWAYGCVTHSLNNIFEDITKECFHESMKEALFVKNCTRYEHGAKVVQNVRRGKCIEGLHNGSLFEVVVVYYQLDVSKASQGEGSTHFLPPACIYQQNHHILDPTFQLSPALISIVNSGQFWDSLVRAANAYDIICKCVGVCGSDSASSSAAFASLLYACVHFRTAQWVSTAKRKQLEQCLVRRTNRIICAVQYLLYVFDPFVSCVPPLRRSLGTLFYSLSVSPTTRIFMLRCALLLISTNTTSAFSKNSCCCRFHRIRYFSRSVTGTHA